jgi:hypothetical protein
VCVSLCVLCVCVCVCVVCVCPCLCVYMCVCLNVCFVCMLRTRAHKHDTETRNASLVDRRLADARCTTVKKSD